MYLWLWKEEVWINRKKQSCLFNSVLSFSEIHITVVFLVSNRVMLKKEIMERKGKRYVTTTVLTHILSFHFFWTENVIFIFYVSTLFNCWKHLHLGFVYRSMYTERNSLTMCLNMVIYLWDAAGRKNWSCVILNWLALDLFPKRDVIKTLRGSLVASNT